jgi:subtilase family serine protease
VATPSGLSPSTIDSVYGFSTSTKSGAGKTIAIVDAYDDPNAAGDLNAFSQQWGLPQCNTSNPCFSKVNQAGATTYPAGNSSWDLEMSLDIEWAHALAPDATILLVEANSNSFADLTAAEKYAGAHADYVSNSWGGSEFSGETAYDSAFTAPSGRKVSYFAATGDTGGAVEYPSTSPNVVAVGGTSLLFSTSGTFSAENTWSSGGGGCSTVEAAPSIQSSFSQYAQAGCNGRRSTPDVALDADPGSGVAVYDSTPYSGSSGWWTVGGTSASTPMWAAESAVLGSTVNVATVYSTTIPFRDVISGSNGHSALIGYDLATGRGSWAYTPGPSTSLSAALASGNVALTWTAPSGAPPTSYSVYRSTTSGTETVLASGIKTASFTTTPPPSGTTYYYKVQAVDAAGAGPFSNEASISSSSPPPTTTMVPRTTTTTTVPKTTTTTTVPRTTTTTTVAHPPTASFTKGCSQASCTFTSTSKDTGGTITTYAWSGGNGISGTASTISHTFTTGGTFSVQLTVTDSRQLTATVTNQVTCSFSGRLTCS